MPLHTQLGREGMETLIELANSAPQGTFVEVGVYKGGSAERLYAITEARGCKLHLYDTFTGIPYSDEGDLYQIGDFDAGGHIPVDEMPNAIFHVGLFPDTLTDDVTDLAFCHIDCDQYRSVRACIEMLYPRMISGAIMVFDDAPYIGAANRAVCDFFSSKELREAAGRYYVIKP